MGRGGEGRETKDERRRAKDEGRKQESSFCPSSFVRSCPKRSREAAKTAKHESHAVYLGGLCDFGRDHAPFRQSLHARQQRRLEDGDAAIDFFLADD